MTAEMKTPSATIWLAQYIEMTRARYQQAAVEHERNALRLEGAAMALRELAAAQDAAHPESTNTADEATVVGQQ